MSSITAQQAKLDLELVPKEKRLEIGKCNGRLNPGKIQREPTFQVVLDSLALTPCYSAFLITADMHQPCRTFAALINRSLSGKTTGLDKLYLSRAQILWGMYHQKNVDYVELLWEDFIYQIDNKAYKKQEKIYYPRFTKVIIHYFLTQDKTLSWRNKIEMHTSKYDYLINTLRFVSTKEETQIYDAILPDSLTSPEMKETKAYKTYLGFSTRARPPTVPVSTEEPTGKSNRIKRPAKKSTKAPARGVLIRETPEIPLSKKKEKVDVTRGKGIKLLSQVALNEDAQFEEVRRKSMRDFYKTHPSGSGAVTIIPSVTSEGTGVKPGVPDVSEEESSESKAEFWGNDEDDSNNEQDSSDEGSDQENDSDNDKTQSDNDDELNSEHETCENESGLESDQEENEEDKGDDKEEVKDELVKTSSNDFDDEDETKITDKEEGDEDEEMDYTTNQLYNDVDIRLNEPVDTNKGFVQEEGTDAAMTNKTEVLVTSSSHSSDLAGKFLNFSYIPHTDAEIISPMDVHVHHEVPSQQTPTLLTVPVSVISESSLIYSTVITQSIPSFTPLPPQSTPTPPPTTEATNPLYVLPNFASVFQFNNSVTALEKEVAELKKDPLHTQVTALVDDHLDARLGATREDFMNFLSASLTARITEQVKNQLPQILPEEVSNSPPPPSVIQKMAQESLEDAVLAKESSQPQSSFEAIATLTEFELKKILIDKMDKSESYLAAPEHRESQKDKDEDPSAGSDRGLKKRKTSKDAEPTKGPKSKESQSGSSKGTSLNQNLIIIPSSSIFLNEREIKAMSLLISFSFDLDLDWNVDKTPQQGQNQSWLLTLSSSAKKPSKTFDELISTPIDFSAFIMNGLEINNLTQETLLGPAFRLLKGTHSNYAELEYDFEECYKALSEKLDWENPEGGDNPFDLTKPLPLVIITQVKVMRKHGYGYLEEIVVRRADNDLYRFKEGDFPRLHINDIEDMLLLKKINITRPENTKPDIRKRDPYTLYQDPQGFIYVDNNGRNRLMRSDELYKFNDRTLTGLRTSLDDITKNI
ncbi:hypothetical protein Tco_1401234 [Tanacetum coccineum]